MDVPEVKAMAELYPVGQIFDNHVYPGVLHNAFMDVGIPAFTPGQRSDAMSEPGNHLLFILFHKATPDGGEETPVI